MRSQKAVCVRACVCVCVRACVCIFICIKVIDPTPNETLVLLDKLVNEKEVPELCMNKAFLYPAVGKISDIIDEVLWFIKLPNEKAGYSIYASTLERFRN